MSAHVWTIRKWHAPTPTQDVRREPYALTTSLSKRENIELITLANLGMTAGTIAEFTGLTESQVRYRMKRFGISVQDFRHGRGPIARMVFSKLANQVTHDAVIIARKHIY